MRFRYADDFSHSPALALQTALSVAPFLLALSGLTLEIDHRRPARVLSLAIERLSPGGGSRDALASVVSGGGPARATRARRPSWWGWPSRRPR